MMPCLFLGWYYHCAGEQIGPVPSAEIARLVAGGQLLPSAEVLQGWQDANNHIQFICNQAHCCLLETHTDAPAFDIPA